MRKTVGILLAVSLAAAACSSDSEPDEDTTETTADAGAESDTGTEAIEPSNIEDLSDVGTLEFVATEQEDGNILIEFEMLPAECAGFALDVEESTDDIAITVRSGLLPDKTIEDCGLGFGVYSTVYEPESPVAGRDFAVGEEREPLEGDTSTEEPTDRVNPADAEPTDVEPADEEG